MTNSRNQYKKTVEESKFKELFKPTATRNQATQSIDLTAGKSVDIGYIGCFTIEGAKPLICCPSLDALKVIGRPVAF
jgi:hypothetical protein